MNRRLLALAILISISFCSFGQTGRSDTTVIPFEFKQSALYHLYTRDVIDSLVYILVKNDSVSLELHGYSHVEEGSDTIAYYLSLNRALFVRDYVLGKGIDSGRISVIKGWGKSRKQYLGSEKQALGNSRAEMVLKYPAPKKLEGDADQDGITDSMDECPEVFGLPDMKGCPDPLSIRIPFEPGHASLHALAYHTLDSIIILLKGDPMLRIELTGHAHPKEGSASLASRLANERWQIVRDYLYSKGIRSERLEIKGSLGISRPVNAARTRGEALLNARAEVRLLWPNSQVVE